MTNEGKKYNPDYPSEFPVYPINELYIRGKETRPKHRIFDYLIDKVVIIKTPKNTAEIIDLETERENRRKTA